MTQSAPAPPLPAAAGSLPWNPETATASLRRFVEKGALAPVRTLIPSADMAEEAVLLAQLGFPVTVVDPRREALDGLAARARQAKVEVDVYRDSFFVVPPTLFGPVELIVDRTCFHALPPIERPAWADRVGRILPVGGRLAGLFLVRRERQGPPYPVTLTDLRRTLERLFILETLEETPGSQPGRPHAYRGLFRHI
jgi:hypothetical protein